MKKNLVKKPFEYNHLFIIPIYLILGIIAVIGIWNYKKNHPTVTITNSKLISIKPSLPEQTKNSFIKNDIFYSSELEFSVIKLPNYQYEERGLEVIISSADKKIRIGQIGTNASNLKDYLSSLETLNTVNILNQEQLSIHSIPVIKAEIKHAGGKTAPTFSYFFYPKQWSITSIETDSADIKKDLETIAQSFEKYKQK